MMCCACAFHSAKQKQFFSSAYLTPLTQFSRVHGADPSIPSKTTSPPAFSADLAHGDESKPPISAGDRTLVAVAVTPSDERKNKAAEAITASRVNTIAPAGRVEKGGEEEARGYLWRVGGSERGGNLTLLSQKRTGHG